MQDIVRIVVRNTMRIDLSTWHTYSEEPLSMHLVLSGYISMQSGMASSQLLLLNKQLTITGMLECIT